MNKAIISGRLTRDPELRYSQSAEPIAVVRFSVACNRRFKRDNEPDADFINCVAFGKTGEFISKFFSKGKMIGIVGSIRTNSWTDNSGQKRYSTEVYVEEADFLESKSSSDSYANSGSQAMPAEFNNQANTNSFENHPQNDDFYSVEHGIEDEDLPF